MYYIIFFSVQNHLKKKFIVHIIIFFIQDFFIFNLIVKLYFFIYQIIKRFNKSKNNTE